MQAFYKYLRWFLYVSVIVDLCIIYIVTVYNIDLYHLFILAGSSILVNLLFARFDLLPYYRNKQYATKLMEQFSNEIYNYIGDADYKDIYQQLFAMKALNFLAMLFLYIIEMPVAAPVQTMFMLYLIYKAMD